MGARRRGKEPDYVRRERSPDLRELLHAVRVARRQVLIAEGHLIAHRNAEEVAILRAWEAGATHRELAEAAATRHRPGWVHPALRRLRRSS